MQLDDSASFCNYCGAPLDYQNPPQPQPQAQQFNYPPAYQQAFSPYAAELKNEISNVKTLGIISLIFIIFNMLVSLICSIIGIVKGNNAIKKAESLGEFQLVKEAEEAKKLSKIALIISIVLTIIAIIVVTAIVALGVYSTTRGSGISGIPDINDFSGF